MIGESRESIWVFMVQFLQFFCTFEIFQNKSVCVGGVTSKIFLQLKIYKP